MATGTIDAQEIGNGSGPITLTKQSAAKAFLSVDMNANATASENISSVTDVGTGSFQGNYTTSFTNNSYNAVTGLYTTSNNRYAKYDSRLAASLRIETDQQISQGIETSITDVSFVAFGDLAT